MKRITVSNDNQVKQEAPERIWISPRQAWLYAKSKELRDPSDTAEYSRVSVPSLDYEKGFEAGCAFTIATLEENLWHLTHVFDGMECCKRCALVRPAEGWTRPCKGPHELSLRADAAHASPAALRDEADRSLHVGSSRHPHLTAADHERMKETLDALSDYPTEEEAEAALQACGTSGKEIVNEFIERLLKENLELKTRLESITTPPAKAADKIADQLIPHLDHAFLLTKGWRDQIASIIERSLSSGS